MAGTKRKKDATKVDSESKKQKQDDATTNFKALNIPIDEGFKEKAVVKVYQGESGDVFDTFLNQTNINSNANKFYRLQLLQENDQQFYAHTRWGRVGEFGQVKTNGPLDLAAASKIFRSKFREKTGLAWEDRFAAPKAGKYTLIEKNYEPEDDDGEDDDAVTNGKSRKSSDTSNTGKIPQKKEKIPSKLPLPVQNLIKLIFDQNHFDSVLENIGYNQDKLPLGKLGQATLKKGFEHLKQIAGLIKDSGLSDNYAYPLHQALLDSTNAYYSTIPHVFGRSRPPLINNLDILQKEVAMLDNLSDMEVAADIMKLTEEMSNVNLIDQRFEQLGIDELTPLRSNTKEFKLLQKYLINSSAQSHNINYNLVDIFRITRRGERERFENSPFGTLKDSRRYLLFHGSLTTNFGGILSQGLRIAPPEAPVNGYAFGKGIYLADVSTKSANYCVAAASGGHGLLLLCEAELGDPMYELIDSDPCADEAARKANCISTRGVGQIIPTGWIDAGAVHESLKGCLMPDPSKKIGEQTKHEHVNLMYNEYICYDVAQVRLRYLLRFTI